MTAASLPFREGARIALIGMGISNRGVLAQLCTRPDLFISIRDRKSTALPEALPFHHPPRVLEGERYLDDLDEDILFLSPTVRSDAPEIIAAKERGALVTTDSAFFLEHTKTTVLAVSGSDGKSTTASLAAEILRSAGASVHLGGNIGTPLSPMLSAECEGDFTVAELSSFQLMHKHKSPSRALLTNLTPNHLDFHSSLEEYYNVKLALLLSAKQPILNLDDDEICTRFAPSNVYVGYTLKPTDVHPLSMEHLYTVRDGAVHLDGKPYLSLSSVLYRGGVFVKNLLAALALTHGLHDGAPITEALAHFHSLPHRRELVRTVSGVRYYDSSVDSSPSRTRETLGDFSSDVILILGGRSKGAPYGILTDVLNKKTRAVVLTGENAALIKAELVGLSVPLYECDSLSSAVSLCASLAEEGDCVLFSPASTSFDRFSNFEERGDCFARLVHAL